MEDTASLLGLSRKGLYLKRQRFGIDPPLKLGIMVAKVIYKGGDVYSTVEGIVESTKTLADPQAGGRERAVAVAQLVGELSGVSDLLKGGKTVLETDS